jgi:hypothetical protein
VADNRGVVKLRSSRKNKLAMLLIASAFGWPLPYVRATTHRTEGAVSFHSPKFAIAEALITESPGEHDVIHPLSSAYEAVLWEPGEAKAVDI